MADRTLRIAVIGGGIGGLAAALALLREGFDVHVYEQAPELREFGAGLQLGPNATRILIDLGIGDALKKHAVVAESSHQRRWDDGRTLLRATAGRAVEEVFGSPHYLVHRADLQSALAARIPAGRLHFGHQLSGLSQPSADGDIDIQFVNGAKSAVDTVIGADGIHSKVRRVIFGEAEPPSFTGCVAYRGVVPIERLAHLQIPMETQIWMGPGRHFVHYPVCAGKFMSFFAGVDQDAWRLESWSEPGRVEDALEAYSGWHDQVRTILGSVDEIFIWGLFQRLPMPRWSVGRVTLLGDACHAMLPFMAQGAAQALEDAAVLALCLKGAGPAGIAEAYRRYETLRMPRATKVQAAASTNKQRFHLPDGAAQVARDKEMAAGTTDWSFDAIKWVYDYDPKTAVRDA